MAGNTNLGQINITLLLVHTKHDNNLVASDPNKLLNRPDTTSGEFGE